MTKAKKIIIRTQSRELFIVRQTAKSIDALHGWCNFCGAETILLSFDESISRSKIGGRKLMRLIQTETVHSIETADGHLLVCRRSLESSLVSQ